MSLVRAIWFVLLSGFVGYGACLLVHLGYDWGYHLTGQFLQQNYPNSTNQGAMAIISLQYAIFPLVSCWSLGYLTRNDQRVWLPFVLGGIASFALYHHLPFLEGGVPRAFCATAFAALVALTSFSQSRRLFRFLQTRMNVASIYQPSAIACAGAALVALPTFIGFDGLEIGSIPECVLYGALLFAIGFAAARMSNARGTTGGAFAATLALLPFLSANALNIFGNLLSLGLDQFHAGAELGVNALISAVLITTCATTACLIGGATSSRLGWSAHRASH